MRKTTLDEAMMNDYAHYAKALMLHRSATVNSSDYQRILADTRPKFTGENGGKMRIKTEKGGDSVTLHSVEDGVKKEITLPLNAKDTHKYLRKLGILNTPTQIGNPMTDPVEWQVNRFYRYPKAERPESFSVTDDYDRVLKHITDYVESTKGGVVSITEARKIVFQAMFDAGVLPTDNEELIDALNFGDYAKDMAALTCPPSVKNSNTAGNVEEPGEGLALGVFLFIVVVLIVMAVSYFTHH